MTTTKKPKEPKRAMARVRPFVILNEHAHGDLKVRSTSPLQHTDESTSTGSVVIDYSSIGLDMDIMCDVARAELFLAQLTEAIAVAKGASKPCNLRWCPHCGVYSATADKDRTMLIRLTPHG